MLLRLSEERENELMKDKKKIVELLQEGSELGNTDAMTNLAECYMTGEGKMRDQQKGIELFERAADLGDANAMFNLAKCYSKGEGVERDDEKAFELCKRAAEKGNSNALFSLGLCYFNGDDGSGWVLLETMAGESQIHGCEIAKNLKKAVNYFQQSADLGNTNAITFLGICNIGGIGIKKDETKGMKLLQRAVDEGNTLALVFPLLLFTKGPFGPLQDKTKAFELFEHIINKGTKNTFLWAASLMSQLDEEERTVLIEFLLRKVDEGNKLAMCIAFEILRNAQEQNKKKISETLQRCAEKCEGSTVTEGNTAPLVLWGLCLKEGIGVPKDEEKATKLFQLATIRGEALALYLLCQGLVKTPLIHDAELSLFLLRMVLQETTEEDTRFLRLTKTMK